MKVFEQGERIDNLTVVERIDRTHYRFKCDCGNEFVAKWNDFAHMLQRKRELCCSDCAEKRHEQLRKRAHKTNIYDLTGDYGIGYTTKGEPFYFDKEDYEKIEQYCWSNSCGYISTTRTIEGKGERAILMHRLIMDAPEGMEVDHINHNKADNRKRNLRVCTHAENMSNNKGHKTANSSPIETRYYITGHEEIGFFRTKREAKEYYQNFIAQF